MAANLTFLDFAVSLKEQGKKREALYCGTQKMSSLEHKLSIIQ